MGSILSAVYLSPGAMARLCLLALFVLSTFSNNSSANTLRVERDACEEKQEEVQKCQADAYQEYMAAFKAGDDGRPDWMARKSCNYITATIEECTNQLVGDCATEEDVIDMKDGQMEGLLEQLSATIEEWDSEKCPAIKAYLDQYSAEDDNETKEEVAASVDTAAQEKEEEEDEETDNGASEERDVCEEEKEEIATCRSGAHEEYAAAIAAGDDGRPDWFARKACNYITGTVEECAEGLVGECNTEEEVNKMKDQQIEGMLDQLSKTVPEWDSEKCPPIKAYLERKTPPEDEEETAEGVPASVDSAAEENVSLLLFLGNILLVQMFL